MISVFGSMVGEEEIQAVAECMRSQWLGFGKNVDAFEVKFTAKTGIGNFAMVDSGSNALYMAVKLLNLPQGSEIIVPSFTWVSCAQAVLLAGHKPVFCDVDLHTMNVRWNDIAPFITLNTGAIMVVHYAGLSVEMAPILQMGYPIIEDAAHAICSTYDGRPCGTMGTVGIFSFDAVKNLTTGEGGGITCQQPEMIARAKILRYCGIGKSGFDSVGGKDRWWEYDISEPFIKMLPTNIAGAIGIAQLDRLDYMQIRRKHIWDYFQDAFNGVGQILRPMDAHSDSHSYFTYCIQVPERDKLAHYLLDKGIYTTLRYHPLHLNPLYGQMDKRLTNCEELNETALSIPLHPRLTDTEVDMVVDSIKGFYRGKA